MILPLRRLSNLLLWILPAFLLSMALQTRASNYVMLPTAECAFHDVDAPLYSASEDECAEMCVAFEGCLYAQYILDAGQCVLITGTEYSVDVNSQRKKCVVIKLIEEKHMLETLSK